MVFIRYPLLFAVAILLAGFVALGAHLSSSTEEYSRYNRDWNGTSAFFSSVAPALELWQNRYLEPESCRTLLILAPAPGYLADDTDRSLLSRGGRIILVDEDGYGNAFLNSLSTSLNVIPGNLSSADSAYRDSGMVRAYPVGNSSLMEKVSSLTMNRPAWVTGGVPLVETSLLSWIDENGNRRPDDGEVLQRYPVIAYEAIGPGEVIVIADASLFINGMQAENPQLLENIHSLERLCIDQRASQTSTAAFLPSLLSGIKDTYIIKIIVVAMIICIGVFVGERRFG